MAQINLVPGTQYIAAARRRRRTLYLITTVVILLTLGAWGITWYLLQQAERELSTVETSIRAVETEIARAGDDVKRVRLFEGRLAAINTLLDSHISWEPLLQDLERLLPPATVLTELRAQHSENTVQVLGLIPNLDELSQVLASVVTASDRSTLFSRGELKNVQRQEQRDADGRITATNYEFEATLTFTK